VSECVYAVDVFVRALGALWWQVPFCMDGPNGVLKHLEYLLETKGKVVMCG